MISMLAELLRPVYSNVTTSNSTASKTHFRSCLPSIKKKIDILRNFNIVNNYMLHVFQVRMPSDLIASAFRDINNLTSSSSSVYRNDSFINGSLNVTCRTVHPLQIGQNQCTTVTSFYKFR